MTDTATAPTAERGEIVQPEASTEVVPATPTDQASAAIVAAAHAAIEQPGVPGRDEFLAFASGGQLA